MINNKLLTVGAAVGLSLGALTPVGLAEAKGFGDWMNPSKWFGGSSRDRDYYYDRDYYGYGHPGGYGWGGPGYGYGGPGYGWGGPYGYGPGYGWGGPGYGYGGPGGQQAAPPPEKPQ